MVFDKIKELEFNEFYKTFKSKIGDALASARNFDPMLKAQRDAIVAAKQRSRSWLRRPILSRHLSKQKCSYPSMTI